MLLSDYISQVRELVHDLQSTDWTDAELTTHVNTARERVALDRHCVRQLFFNLSLIPTQEIYPIQGGIGGIAVLTGGSAYVTPVVAIGAPPAGGVQAAASAVVTGGVIVAINMTNWGSGYTSTPNVTITDAGGGTGATGSAVALVRVLDVSSCTVLYPGNSLSIMMGWLPWTYFQAWIRMNRNQFGFPNWYTTHTETNQLFFGRPPDQSYRLEIDAAVLPNPLVTLTDADTQVIPPNTDAVQWYAARMAMMKLQNFDQAEYYNKAYERRIMQIGQTRQGRRLTNVYNNSIMRMLRGW